MARGARTTLSTTLGLGLLLLGLGSAHAGPPPDPISVSWATVGDPLALGEPGDDAAMAATGGPITFSGFSDRISYPDLDAALLAAGVSPAQLDAADFIAFDLNGTTGGVEGALWTFDDGQGGVLETMHGFGGIGPAILANRDVVPSDYEALFVALPPTAPFVGVILFDLSAEGLNPFAPGLSATLEGLDAQPVNTPDPPGLGVIHRPTGGCGDAAVDPGEQCDDGNVAPGDGCDALCQDEEGGPGGAACAPAPAPGCLFAARARISVKETKPGSEKLEAKLGGFDGPTGQSDLGDPLTGATRYDLCLYDAAGQLAAELSVERAGQSCGPKARPCFKDRGGRGWRYKDPGAEASGTKKIVLGSGPAGKGKALWQAGNKASKGQTALPTGIAAGLAGATEATLQLHTSDGVCLEATLPTVKKAAGARFEAKAP